MTARHIGRTPLSNADKADSEHAYRAMTPFRVDWDGIRRIVDVHPVVSHPFLCAFESGRLTKPQARFWVVQQFFFSVSLPSAFAAIYARVPDKWWKEKRALLDLLRVEAWGSRDYGSHSRHFMELCEYLEIDVEGLSEADAKDYTQRYVASRLDICLDTCRPLGQALLAIGLGNEVLNLFIFRAYRNGIRKIYGMEKCPTGYFDAHLQDESRDAQVFLDLFARVATSAEEQVIAQGGLRELLDKRLIYLDALWADVQLIS